MNRTPYCAPELKHATGTGHCLLGIRGLLFILLCFIAEGVEAAESTPTLRPHLFLTEEKVVGLRSIAELRLTIEEPGHIADLWKRLLGQAKLDQKRPVITPANFQGKDRSNSQQATANPDYYVCQAAGQRILRNALACLVTGELHYRDTAWEQIASLFDDTQWPDWRDRAHREYPADLRTGSLGRDIAIAYDWMYQHLTPTQRRAIVAGLDRRAIQPFWQGVDAGVWWADGHNNWTTCIVGGLGMVGMALAEDHPDSQRLIEFSERRMRNYLSQYGSEGEFNESVGYSAATRLPVTYFNALRYFNHGDENTLGQGPLLETAIWNAYTYLPPGRMMAFGDAFVDRPAELAYFGAVAAASRNESLQWFYLNGSAAATQGAEDLPLWILSFDPKLRMSSPEGQLPLGRAFREYGAILVSRSSWDFDSTECVVYGKAGIERNHEHHDAGQLCIDGYGQRLIVDLGSPSGYPSDFFGKNRWSYYNASWIGHNVVTVDGEEMNAPRGACAKFLAAEFDDRRGGYWQLDLSALVPHAQRAIRTVAHLTPGVVAVVDDISLDAGEQMSLRWHTVDQSTPLPDGSFVVHAEDARLAGRVLSLDGQTLKISRGEHAYQPPFDTDRTGAKLTQRRESFILVHPTNSTARILSLFAVLPPEADVANWKASPTGYRIETSTGRYTVSVHDDILALKAIGTEHSWHIPLGVPGL